MGEAECKRQDEEDERKREEEAATRRQAEEGRREREEMDQWKKDNKPALDVCRTLIAKKADLHLKNKQARTPVDMLFKEGGELGMPNLVSVLCTENPDLDKKMKI